MPDKPNQVGNPSSPDEPRWQWPLDDAGWRWQAGKAPPTEPGNPSPGQPVSLPHCWNAAEEYRPGIVPRRGWATYELDLAGIPSPPDREWRLRCEGFYGTGRAWVNRRPVGCFNGDYLGFDLDVTAALRPGANRIVVQVSNRHSRKVLPGLADPDFHLYGGLGGGMHLVALPRVRLVRNECRAEPDAARPGALAIDVGAVNRAGDRAVRTLQIVVRDPSGQTVAAPEPAELAVSSGEPASRRFLCEVPAPRLWSPESPELYSVEATLREGDQVRDRLSWTFGWRTVRFEAAHGMLLNGRPVVLRGVNRHENLPGFGFALPRALHAEDARLIKEMGLDFVRLSHYPQSPAFLDACDRLGLLVYAELCSWKNIRGGSWLAAAESQLERMIRRDRHHPSIVLWGLGNEGRHRGAFLRLQALARELDPSRATIYAENHARRARRKKTAGLTDVWGLNYELEELDFARTAAPTGCVVVSECANLPYARRGHWPAEAQQTALIRDAVRRVEGAGPGAVGWTLWCFADYATPRRQRWFRECGMVDGWRAAKTAADWLRARYRPEPFLSVRGDWSRAAGPRRRLYVVTNCAEVEIVRADGTRAVRSTPLADLYEWDEAFDGAPLRFLGRHPAGPVETRLVPWDAPAALALRAERLDSRNFRCALQVADAQGVAVGGYEGEALVHLPAGVRASLIGGDRLPVHAGQAVFYVERPCDGSEVQLECVLDDFKPQIMRLAPEERAP